MIKNKQLAQKQYLKKIRIQKHLSLSNEKKNYDTKKIQHNRLIDLTRDYPEY